MSRGYRSIGEVMSLLAEEHPDLTISKIRFLESQGLIAPQRTPSGYRKFFDTDVEQLNWVLVQQRDHYLPLKEIKRRLAAGAASEPLERVFGDSAAEPDTPSLFTARPSGEAAEDSGDPDADTDAGDAPPTGAMSLGAAELARASGTDADYIEELLRLGIIAAAAAGGDAGPVFDHEALLTARTAAALAAHGVPARSLRMFKNAADREAGVYEQVLAALIARGDATRLRAEIAEIVELTESLHRLLLRRALRPHLD